MMYSVSYKNNLDRVAATIVDGTTTPRQFIQSNGVSLGNYNLQLNGIALALQQHFGHTGNQTEVPVNLEQFIAGGDKCGEHIIIRRILDRTGKQILRPFPLM